jgi:hypothetical protein
MFPPFRVKLAHIKGSLFNVSHYFSKCDLYARLSLFFPAS